MLEQRLSWSRSSSYFEPHALHESMRLANADLSILSRLRIALFCARTRCCGGLLVDGDRRLRLGQSLAWSRKLSVSLVMAPTTRLANADLPVPRGMRIAIVFVSNQLLWWRAALRGCAGYLYL